MLLSFAISNFRSFRDEQTLSIVASNRYDDHLDHLLDIPDDENKALPVAVIYGQNGAGKSNLVKALALVKGLVQRGTEPKKAILRRPFLLDEESAAKPTQITLQFIEDGRAYAYGCSFTERIVASEWLVLLRGGREMAVFERVTHENEKVEIEVGAALTDKTWGNHSKVVALAKVGALANQLFLNSIHKGVPQEEQGPVIAAALRWFGERLAIVGPQADFGELARLVATDEAFREFAGQFLRGVWTGVDKLRLDTSEVDEGMLAGLARPLQGIIDQLPAWETTIMARPDGSQVIVEKAEGSKVRLRTLQAEHVIPGGKRFVLPFSEESDGTQRVTHLLPPLHALRARPCVFVIDEIDRSLHPLLVKAFVRFFLKAALGSQSQLIATSQDIGLMDLEILRRDEIWFADKDRFGSTELYSLSDYKVRTDLKVDKGYLQGRFGAIPVMGMAENLFEVEALSGGGP